jgi:hypothetical protein
VAVVAAGERWRGDLGPAAPAVEDMLGAGAVIRARRRRRPRPSTRLAEARAALAAFDAARDDLAPGWPLRVGPGAGRPGMVRRRRRRAVLDAETVAPVLVGPEFRGSRLDHPGRVR